MYKLYTKYLRKNIPINYTNIPDITIDPLTFVLLIKPADLIKFIKTDTNKHKKILDLYSTYISSKKNLKNTDIKYNEKCIELAINKKVFDDEMYNIENYFSDIKINNTQDDDKNKTEKIEHITTLKVKYMSFIFELADLINEIYTLQTVYFTATKELLIEIKQNYINIIQNYEDTTLAFECIDNDILTVQLLISEDSENKCSQKYFSNYNAFKEIYKKLNTQKMDILDPKINYMDEIEFYTNNPDVISIEIKLYEIYNFQMFLFYSYNQCDIWVLLFKTNKTFTSNIFEKSTDIVKNYDTFKKMIDDPKYKKYNEDINKTTVHIKPVLNKTNNKSSETTWFLENENGEKIIKNKDKNGIIFQKLYIDYIKKSVNVFDIIFLYIYLLEKYCLLQSRVYISEANIIYINIDYEISLDYYYIQILDYIDICETNKQEIFIPSSILWKTDNFNNIDIINNKRATYDKKLFIYYNRIRSIEKSREKILLLCQEFYKQITPNISKKTFIKLCNDMINKQETIIEPYSLGNTIDTIYDNIEKYDIVKINEFNYNIDSLVNELYYDRVINEDDNIKSYFDWIVFKNENKGQLPQAIAEGLNRQLELTYNTTTNKYTENINGKQMFTANSLIKMTNDKKTSKSIGINIDDMIAIWEKHLGIKFIILEMFTRPVNEDINIGDIVLYKGLINDYKPHRVISKQTTNTGTGVTVTYNLYDGLNIFENIENKEQIIEKNVLNELNQFVKKPITIKTIIKDLSRNSLENFRIYCNSIYNNDFDNYDDYMYILHTKNTYQLVRDVDNDYIFKKDQIPNYIRYLIYNSCPKLRDDKYFSDFKNKIDENINSDDIDKEIINIKEIIKENENILDDENENENEDEDKEDNQENNIKKDLIIQKIDKFKRQLKTLENKKRAKNTKGGNPNQNPNLKEQYSQNVTYNPVGGPRNVIYYPQQQYINPRYSSMGYNQQMLPYFTKQNNVIQNKAKDQKSKLSFYIEIELELFPGTSVNLLQKGIVKCQSTFERIREAWADIRGVEYRPSPMKEAYEYVYNTKNEKNKTLKKTNNNNNKTLKKYSNS
jgi:hypothetical protein